MQKFLKFISVFIVALFLISNVVPSIAYASETNLTINEQQQIQQAVDEIERKLSRPIYISENELDARIQEAKQRYPELSEERMKELVYQALSPYSFRASVWDGQGVTLSEFAWVVENIIATAISGGVAGIGNLVKKKGLAVAKATLSRVAKKAAIRLGIYSNRLAALLERVFDYINIFYNVGYAVAQWVDARDVYPNNGRINAWA